MLEEDIISQHLRSLSKRDPYVLRKPVDFERWCNYSMWFLDEAVILLLGFEPITKFLNSFYTTREFDEIYKCLLNDLSAGYLGPVPNGPITQIQVRPSAFVHWAETMLKKKIFLPVPEVINGACLINPTRVPPVIKCFEDDPRIAEYLTNLEKMKVCFSERSIESVKPDSGELGLSLDNDELDSENDVRIKKIIEDVTRLYPKATSKNIISHCFGCFKGNTRKLNKIKQIMEDLGVEMNKKGGALSKESKKYMQNAPKFEP